MNCFMGASQGRAEPIMTENFSGRGPRGRKPLIDVGWRYCAGLMCVIAALCLPITLSAQNTSSCKGPSKLESALSVHTSAAGYDMLGAYFGRRGLFSCAISAFKSSVRLEPDAWQGHYGLAFALLSSGNAARGYHEMYLASTLAPNKPEIHLGLGFALLQLHRPDAAISEFHIILQANPKSVAAFDGVARALIAEKRYVAAIDSLRDIPSVEKLQLDLAIAYSKNHQPGKALQILTAMVKAGPGNAKAYLDLGIVYTQQSRYDEAAREFRKALHISPNNSVIRTSYLQALIILKKYQAALPVAQGYLRRMPHSFEALVLAGEVDRGLGDYKKAANLLRQAVKVRPNEYNAHYYLGSVLESLGQPIEARKQFERALQLSPGSSEARFQLGSVLRTLGKQNEARKDFTIVQENEAEGRKKDRAIMISNEANRYLQSGDIRKAAAMYEQSIALYPNDSHTYYDLALALHQQAKYGEEQQALMRAIQVNPNFAPAHNQLGILDLRRDLVEKAGREFKTAILLNPQYAKAQNNLGVVDSRRGETKQAELLFRQATENSPKFVAAWVNLGLALASESDFPRAERALQKALRLSSGNTRARRAQAMVLKRLHYAPSAVLHR